MTLNEWGIHLQALREGFLAGREQGHQELLWELHASLYHRRWCDCGSCKLRRALDAGRDQQTDEAREIPEAVRERLEPADLDLPDLDPPELEFEVDIEPPLEPPDAEVDIEPDLEPPTEMPEIDDGDEEEDEEVYEYDEEMHLWRLSLVHGEFHLCVNCVGKRIGVN